MIILGTNVVSELIRAAPDPGVLAWVNSRPSTQVATTAVTAAELHYGVAVSRRPALAGRHLAPGRSKGGLNAQPKRRPARFPGP